MRQIVLILMTVGLNVSGQFLMKRGMNSVGAISGDMEGLVSGLIRAIFNPFVMGGIFVYGLSTICWLVLLSRVDLSYAYPALSLGYVLITLASSASNWTRRCVN
ncbi:4-amino-4-deoxy-L-arabinose transferase [Chloroflexi bacterium TSY]|nr:4-amino-4-deoxy-L-arabinose transferase [Chloroflexi bacterium TSY]